MSSFAGKQGQGEARGELNFMNAADLDGDGADDLVIGRYSGTIEVGE